MRVVNVKSYRVDSGAGKNWLFVKVETDDRIHGWGEAYTYVDRDRSVQAYVDAMARQLEGKNPFHIKTFVLSMYVDFGGRRPSLDLFAARSALEQALWDIVGKSLDQPVYNLFGGPCRETVRVYANGWTQGATTPSDLADRAQQTVALGFDALKFDPFPDLWREQLSPDEESEAVARIAAVREAVGSGVDLLIEAHRRFDSITGSRLAGKLSKYDPFWYEEPVDVQNLDSLVEVRRVSSIPIVTGETLYTKDEFLPVLAARGADIVNPDVCATGIGGLLEIGSLADAYRVRVAPHNYNSTSVGLASTLHVAASLPNFLITEYFVNAVEASNSIAVDPFSVEDGRILLPDRPGLGIDLDEDALRSRPGSGPRAKLAPEIYVGQ